MSSSSRLIWRAGDSPGGIVLAADPFLERITLIRSQLSAGWLRIGPVAALAALALGACSGPKPAANPPPAHDWSLIGGNDYEQHFSELKQINATTVAKLGLKWYADMPTRDGLTGVPMVANGAVFQSGAMGKAWANDLRTGKQLWEFDSHIVYPVPNAVAGWGVRQSRGLTLWGDKVLKASGDCRLFALDQKTGATIWEAKPCDPAEYKGISAAPRVGDGKVFMGNANADFGIGRGWVDAYEIATGKHLWRFYTMPGDPAKGFESKTLEMASKTWGKDYWKNIGGGSAWEGITYDPRTRLVLIGTDGPSPADPTQRGKDAGDELFSHALVAVNADTGEYVWHYSFNPNDGWNWSATQPVNLADLTIDGAKVPAVLIAPKNGFFYVIDARTGKLVNEPKPIVPVNWASRIDMKTGRPVMLPDAQYWNKGPAGAVVRPGALGAHGWMPMSYSPETGLVYIPVGESSFWEAINPKALVAHVDADQYWGMKHGEWQGKLLAWDPIRQEKRWEVDTGRPYQGGTLVTSGGIVFQGHTDGTFNAYDAATGKVLWSYDAQSSILGAPSTVEIDGEQLVLVPVGTGTTSSVGFLPEIADRGKSQAPRLLAFSLGGAAKLPPPEPDVGPFLKPAGPAPTAAMARAGKAVWDANGCEVCHGVAVIGGLGSVPDIRRITPERLSLLSEIVRGGLFKATGMPIFADSISEQDLPALKAYLLDRSWDAYRQQEAKLAKK